MNIQSDSGEGFCQSGALDGGAREANGSARSNLGGEGEWERIGGNRAGHCWSGDGSAGDRVIEVRDLVGTTGLSIPVGWEDHDPRIGGFDILVGSETDCERGGIASDSPSACQACAYDEKNKYP